MRSGEGESRNPEYQKKSEALEPNRKPSEGRDRAVLGNAPFVTCSMPMLLRSVSCLLLFFSTHYRECCPSSSCDHQFMITRILVFLSSLFSSQYYLYC